MPPGIYAQTSTANPYGHRPWATSLYTNFENYAFLKQPQNAILREDLTMRPEIYRPPEMKLGDMTLVGGSGRILRRGRHRGLGFLMSPTNRMFMSPPASYMIRMAPPQNGAPPIRAYGWGATPIGPGPLPYKPPVAIGPAPYIPPTILPPSMVPPPVAQGAALPIGSPLPPPTPSPAPSPVSPTAAPTAAGISQWLSNLFSTSTWIAGIPDGYVALGVIGGIFLLSRDKETKGRKF